MSRTADRNSFTFPGDSLQALRRSHTFTLGECDGLEQPIPPGMYQRVPRFPPLHARLVRLEDAPPMYRMLGYADRNNMNSDLHPCPVGYYGPFAFPRIYPNQQVHFGAGRFGLPSQPLAFSTVFWDENETECHTGRPRPPHHQMAVRRLISERPEALAFPELGVPGSGVRSTLRTREPAPRRYCIDNVSTFNQLNLY